MNLAGSLGPLLVTVLLQYYDWRTILYMSGVFCASFSFLCVAFVKNEPKDVGLTSIEAAAKKKGGEDKRVLSLEKQDTAVTSVKRSSADRVNCAVNF